MDELSDALADPYLFEIAARVSNWGRWGGNDQLGTLNLITQREVLAALCLCTEGLSLSLSRVLDKTAAAPGSSLVVHQMTQSGTFLHPTSPGLHEFFGLVFHGSTVTHVDALSHTHLGGRLYNGHHVSEVSHELGATIHDVDGLHRGVITRGILLDLAGVAGVRHLKSGEPILVEQLEEAERQAGVRVGRGDALLVRTGWPGGSLASAETTTNGRPGLHASTLPWLSDRDVAIVASDAPNDVVPSGVELEQPIHQIGQVLMGMPLVDCCDFEELRAECLRLRRWEFMFSLSPLRIRFGTGSPVNPVATF